LAMGATSVAMGRPFLIAANAYPMAEIFIGKEFYKFGFMKKIARLVYPPSTRSVALIQRFVETVRLEIQLLVSSLGKYDMALIDIEDIMAVHPQLARVLHIQSVYDLGTDSYNLASVSSLIEPSSIPSKKN